MPHTVQISRSGIDLTGSTAEMRAWLDHNRIEAVAFEHSSSPSPLFLRKAFAQAFQGRISDGTTRDHARKEQKAPRKKKITPAIL